MKGPIWIDFREVVAIHDRLLSEFGGAPGIRDQSLLLSALARPRQLHSYGDSPDIPDLACSYIAGIVRNHPFIDGNKRTGFLVGVLFLEVNGYSFCASEEEVVNIMVSLAGSWIPEPALASFIRSNSSARNP